MTIPNNIYDYLEQSGVLETASREVIEQAKQAYWKLRRKEWRKQQRQHCKSCTVFFTIDQHRLIVKAISGKQKNVTGYVKQAALNTATNKQSIGKELVGKARETFFATYATIDTLGTTTEIKNALIELEEKILFLIQ